jgi:hypothetical protein
LRFKPKFCNNLYPKVQSYLQVYRKTNWLQIEEIFQKWIIFYKSVSNNFLDHRVFVKINKYDWNLENEQDMKKKIFLWKQFLAKKSKCWPIVKISNQLKFVFWFIFSHCGSKIYTILVKTK